QGKNAFFYAQTTLLHGSVNAVFICADFISLYVALEVIGIAAFLLIAYPRTDRSIWVGLRYLFVSNTAMLFYLIGAVLVYQANHSFAFMGLQDAPTEAMALIFLGLLTKGGLFVSGLWLPLTHGESETPVSALLSGVVVKAGVFPLVRCGLMMEAVTTILSIFAVGATLLGVTYAIVERDTKRMLAASTLSQMGFVLVTPAAAGLYALTHGLAKATLFLSVGNLPSRKFQELRQGKLPLAMWVALAIPSLSMAGLPLLAGFGAKAQTLSYLSGWQQVAMSGAAVGTAIAFSKLLFLPTKPGWPKLKAPGLGWALLPLLSGLLLANSLYGDAYTLKNLIKALTTIGGGWLLYGLISWCIAQNSTKRLQLANVRLPATVESLENLIGIMSLILLLLLGMTLA
ncbi:MAG: cation:proton antiporter, partial [Cyanobacteria bacterium J06626_26]